MVTCFFDCTSLFGANSGKYRVRLAAWFGAPFVSCYFVSPWAATANEVGHRDEAFFGFCSLWTS